MGMTISHNAFQGSYSTFNQWRMKLAAAIGLYLELMEGYNSLRDARYPYPMKWELLKPDALYGLFYTEGDHIPTEQCSALADRLEELLPQLPSADFGEHWDRNYWREMTQQFIAGLRKAASQNEPLSFH